MEHHLHVLDRHVAESEARLTRVSALVRNFQGGRYDPLAENACRRLLAELKEIHFRAVGIRDLLQARRQLPSPSVLAPAPMPPASMSQVMASASGPLIPAMAEALAALDVARCAVRSARLDTDAAAPSREALDIAGEWIETARAALNLEEDGERWAGPRRSVRG